MASHSLRLAVAIFAICSLANSFGSAFILEGISGGWVFGNPFYPVPALIDAAGNVYAYNGAASVGSISILDVETAYVQVGLGFLAISQVYLFQGTSSTVYLSARPYFDPAAVVTIAQTTSFSASSVYELCYYQGYPGFTAPLGK
ncbi:hypothetical protein WJX84_008466 [Apatococcus fuscideae]|uniref:Uncharacterized protein n=1 Tax=Apatococcus fuscideae TaxID=2026836 RepID=A0AAW1T8F6_9CHLO